MHLYKLISFLKASIFCLATTALLHCLFFKPNKSMNNLAMPNGLAKVIEKWGKWDSSIYIYIYIQITIIQT